MGRQLNVKDDKMKTTVHLKDETLTVLSYKRKSIRDIDFAHIVHEKELGSKTCLITPNDDFDIDMIDIDYEKILFDEHDKQKIYGYIVFKDKTWFERRSCCGEEYWEYNVCPCKDAKII